MNSIPENGLELLQVMQHGNPQNEAATQIKNKAKVIYLMLSKESDVQDMSEKVNELISDFNNYTNLSPKKLNSEDKLYLMYSVRDIMDDVKIKVQEKITRQKQESAHPSFPAFDVVLSAFQFVKIYSHEESLLNCINSYEQSVNNDVKFKIMEKKIIKQYEKSTLENQMFIKIRNKMSQSHNLKEELTQNKTYFDFERDMVNPVINLFYDSASATKHGIIETLIQPFTPTVLFKDSNTGFNKYLQKKIRSVSPKTVETIDNLAGANFLRSIGARIVNNLDLVTDEKNMARATVKLNDTLSKIFTALARIEKDQSKEDFLYHLGINPASRKTSEKFLLYSQNSIIENLTKLIISQQKSKNITVLDKIKNAGIKFGEASIESLTSKILENILSLDEINNMLNNIPKFKKDDPLLIQLGIEDQCEKINNNIDVILLYLISTTLEELQFIAKEARQAKLEDGLPDISRMSDAQALESVKDSCFTMIDSLMTLSAKSPKDNYIEAFASSCYRKGLSTLLKQVIALQGTGGLLDASTSFYHQFIQEWLVK